MVTIRRYRGKLIVDWIDTNGKRHRERVKDREAGKKRVKEILAAGEKSPTKGTFKAYAEKWLEHQKGEIAASTWQEYEAVLRNHVFPTVGNKSFAKVTKPMIRELITTKRKEGYEPATIRNMLAPVRGMYNQAIEDGEPVGNPAAKFGKQNRGKQKTIINPYTKEEVSLFLKKTLELCPEKYPLYLCAVRTGMRRGELLALQRSDIDFEKRLIHVQRSLSRHGTIKAPKSGKTRLVDMSRQLAAVLQEFPDDQSDTPLFQSTTNTYLDPSNLYKNFRRHLDDAGLRKIRFHDLRHTFATEHIKNNQSLAYIRDQLGHSSIEITVNLYGHLVPGYNQNAADSLDD
jgi:integrase